MPRGSLTAHANQECPLGPVDCVFSWAGCNDKPLRKDVHVHTADTKHMTLLAVACGHSIALSKYVYMYMYNNKSILYIIDDTCTFYVLLMAESMQENFYC
uniref:Uncharacterized protein n=1 Tax=Amphimedon queenslandica TaxID=400682 RepID=A0A1X7SXG9_AMPQE